MLDETLPPAGDAEPAASTPADQPTEPEAPSAGVEAAASADDQPAAPTDAASAEPPAEAVADEVTAQAADAGAAAGSEPAAPAPAAAPEMSPAACAAQLAERFPALFAAGRALPIKLRIQVDIQARAPGVFTRKAMSLFLHRYTTSTAYLKALVTSPHRFDLDGAPAGEVAAEHLEAAQIELQRRQAIMQERRVAQRRMERPPRPGPAASAGPETGPQAAADAGPAPVARDAGQPQRPQADNRPRPPQQRPRRDDRRPQGQPRPPAAGMRHDGRTEGPPRAPRPPPSQRRDGGDGHGGNPAQPRVQPQPSLPPAEMEARRERAALLRAYESSTLTKANFCVLKRVSEADLDSALAQARNERGEAPPRPGR